MSFKTQAERWQHLLNGNSADNRISNLRDVSKRTNNSNRKSHRDGKLVGARVMGSKWNSNIKINYKSIYLGTFDTEEEAHICYLLMVNEQIEKGNIK